MQDFRDLNVLANEVTRREGGKHSISIAQTKEVLRILSDIFVEVGFFNFVLLACRMRAHAKERRKKEETEQLQLRIKLE